MQRPTEEHIFQEVQRLVPDLWSKVEEKDLGTLKNAIKETFAEIEPLDQKAESPAHSVANFLSHLPADRQSLIKTSFRIQTYQTVVNDDKKTAHFLRDGKEILSTVDIGDESGLTMTRNLTIISIGLESVAFLLNMVGASISPGRIASVVKKLADSTKLMGKLLPIAQRMADELTKGRFKDVAEGIVQIIIAIYKSGDLGSIIKDLLIGDSWWEITKTIVKAVAIVASWVLSGGIAAIVKLVQELIGAVSFLDKLRSLAQLGITAGIATK